MATKTEAARTAGLASAANAQAIADRWEAAAEAISQARQELREIERLLMDGNEDTLHESTVSNLLGTLALAATVPPRQRSDWEGFAAFREYVAHN